MKSLMSLWKKLAEESASRCCTSATMDIDYVQGRVDHEGLEFLTITLPSFGKGIERSLDDQMVKRSSFKEFSFPRTRRKRCLPRFLSGFTASVFDASSGVLLDDPSWDAILAIRQLTLMFGKMQMPCSKERTDAAYAGYVECEKDVRASDWALSGHDLADFTRISDMLYSRAFTKVDHKVFYGELVPKHGPGATADRLRGNAKYRQRTWPARLEKAFNATDFLLANPSYYGELDSVDTLEPGSEIPVRVITVPKTLKTPRIIGVEPTAMQYAQQSLLQPILESLGEDSFLSKVIGFDDQTPNQRMAREGSISGTLATLDLSEASDRVSNRLVQTMLHHHPHMLLAVDACRSRTADVDGHGNIPLAKFASMGSALCFPFEAMVFLTLVILGIEKALNTQLTPKSIHRFRDSVRIYGDDIIVPVDYVPSVIGVLSTFGSKVNVTKSFWNGKFRESCGKEYYDGDDVSIVKVRQLFPESRRDVTEVISVVSLRNQLYFAGYWDTVRWLDKVIEGILNYFPTVLPSSPVLGRHSFLGFETQKLDEHLHSPLVKGWKVRSEPPKDPLDGHGALHKCLLTMERRTQAEDESPLAWMFRPVSDESHLERSGRPNSSHLKLGYGSST